MKQLFALLNDLQPPPPGLFDSLSTYLVRKEITKNKFLLKEGQVCVNLYFIEKGLVRFFCIDYKEEEVTTRFMKEGDFIISIESFYEQTASLENIITVEDSTIWRITYDQRQALCEEFPAYNFYSRTLAEKYFVQDMKRMFSIGRKSVPERYQELLQQEPYLFNRASQQHIASYLRMTPEMLSSIIRNN